MVYSGHPLRHPYSHTSHSSTSLWSQQDHSPATAYRSLNSLRLLPILLVLVYRCFREAPQHADFTERVWGGFPSFCHIDASLLRYKFLRRPHLGPVLYKTWARPRVHITQVPFLISSVQHFLTGLLVTLPPLLTSPALCPVK